MIATTPAALAVSVVAVVTSVAFAVTMLPYRTDPATRPVIGIAVTLCLAAVVHLAVVDLTPVREALGIQWGPTALAGGVWILVAFDLSAVVGAFWFLFALQYTGRDRETSPVAYAAVGLLLVLLLAATSALAVLRAVVDVPTGGLNAVLGLAFVLSAALAVLGVFLVVETTLRRKAFPLGQTASLTVAVGAVLALPFVATTLREPVATPLAVTVASVLLTAAVRRYRIFETLPVASVVSRERVVDEMSAGVVVVDAAERIRDFDAVAETVFDVDRADAVGQPLDVVPCLADRGVPMESGSTEVRTDAGRIVTLTTDAVTDDRGRERGSLLVCRDVTERRNQERRLGVLTQLLAGATQKQLGAVAARADEIAAGEYPPADGADRIHDTATDVATLVARVRDVEGAIADQHGGAPATVDVTEVVSDLAATADLDVTAPGAQSVRVTGDPDLLTATLDTLVAGVADGDGTPELRLVADGDAVTVEITPFGPVADGTPAAVSLEIARLAAEHTDWRVRFVDAPAGPTAVVSLPTADEAAPAAHHGGDGT